MTYLYKFNEVVDQSDVDDITDIFKELADELNLSRSCLVSTDSGTKYYPFNVYGISINPYNPNEILLKFDFTSEDKKDKLNKFNSCLEFCKRLRKIGYNVPIDIGPASSGPNYIGMEIKISN